MSTELSQYKSDGFLVAKNLMDRGKIQSMLDSLLRTINDQLSIHFVNRQKMDLFSALKTLHSIEVDRYKRVVGALWRKEQVYRLMHDECITGFLREKFGWSDLFVPGGQVIHIMAHELKIPNGYFGLIPHQDFPSVQGSLDGVIAWLPLVDVDRSNFPLEIIPGSHLRGLLPMINRGESTWEVDPNYYNDNEFFPVEVEAGDVIFMSIFMIHRSSMNGGTGRFRLAMSTRFDNASEPTFIERAYPTAYTRSVHRELYLSGFPSLEQIKSVFSRS